MAVRATPQPITVGAAPPPTNRGGPTLDLEQQDQNTWCWAACVEMVLKRFALSPGENEQCQIAEKGLKLAGIIADTASCCPASSNNSVCNRLLSDKFVTDLWEAYGVPVRPDFGPFIFNEQAAVEKLLASLNQNHPVELGFSDDISHVVMLFRWERDPDGTLRFLYHNPGPGSGSTDSVSSDRIVRSGSRILDATWEILIAG